MQPWQIIFLIAVIIVIVYCVFLIFVVTMAFAFRGKLDKRLVAVNILFSEKRDVLLALYAEFKRVNVVFSPSDEDAISKLRDPMPKNIKGTDAATINKILNSGETHLNYLAAKNQWATKSQEYVNFSSSLHDLDLNYRKNVAIYNRDISGYTYWTHVKLCFLFMLLFGFRKRDPIA